jgi:predicted MPP superfamily phosphohydrolase
MPKKASSLDSLTIVAASDIHLGTIIGRWRFDRIVEKINSLNPDVVLLPGDIFDEDLHPVIRHNQGEAFRNIKSRFGIFAVNGNHEYIGGVEEADAYMVEHGIKLLRDEIVKVDESFFIVGRDDRSAGRYAGRQRKQLAELMQRVDRNYPVILMDHQPFELNEAVSAGVDLQLSGHTHYGQLWPLNYIIKRIYELPWGYKKVKGTHFYVSDGVGTWGPPIRIGNRPEIVNIHIKLN